jgi:hypothetical protein
VDILPALIESLSKCGFLTDHLAMPHTHAEAEAEGAVDKGRHREGVDSNKKRGQGRRWEKKSKASNPVQTHQDESNTEPDPESISSGRWPYPSLTLRLQLLSPLILPSSIYLHISMLDISSLICLSYFSLQVLLYGHLQGSYGGGSVPQNRHEIIQEVAGKATIRDG